MNVNLWDLTDQIQALIRSRLRVDRDRLVDPDTPLAEFAPPREAGQAMSEYTLRLRRYDPVSGQEAYWEQFVVELDGHRSVLDAILKRRAERDGTIGIRCSCRAAICGSCGVRINGKPGLACHTHLARAAAAGREGQWGDCGRADGQHAGDQGPDRRHGRGTTGRRSSGSRPG